MAAPLAHIFLAAQMLMGPLQGLYNEKEFIVGTSFPDIQYLKVVPRAETHFTNVTLHDVLQEKDSCKAGIIFHSLVDEHREAYVVKHNFYDAIPQFRFSTQSLKFAEDRILKTFFDVKKYLPYFDNVLEAEKTYGIEQNSLQDWHRFLQDYLNEKSSIQVNVMKYFDHNNPHAWFIKRWLFSWFYAKKIESAVSIIIENKRIKNLITDFYMNFSNELIKNNSVTPLSSNNSPLKILFGSYCEILPALGLSSNASTIIQNNQIEQYSRAIEMIAQGYINAGATLPTINAFFLRRLLHHNQDIFFKKMLTVTIQALLKAFSGKIPPQIALCLGPMHDCYLPDQAPTTQQAYFFHKRQYELCLESLHELKIPLENIIFLHETLGTEREALGISQAAQSLNVPLIISFVVNKKGHLLSEENVETTIKNIDTQTSNFVKGFSLNCCSPFAFERVVTTFNDKTTIKRLIGFYPGSYDDNHALYDSGQILFEPPKKESLQAIVEVSKNYALQFIGGCCGFKYENISYLTQRVKQSSTSLQ